MCELNKAVEMRLWEAQDSTQSLAQCVYSPLMIEAFNPQTWSTNMLILYMLK